MENEVHYYEARITWRYKGIMHSDQVYYRAADYTEFMERINREYAFADEYTVISIRHVIINKEGKYIEGKRVK